MNEHLLSSIVDILLLVESGSDEEIDPDFAVTLMETIAAHVQNFTEKESAEFVGFCNRYSKQVSGRAAKSLVKQMPENLGLV